MRRFRTFVSLPPARRNLLLRSVAGVAAVRLKLAAFGFPRLAQPIPCSQRHAAYTPADVAWSIPAASSMIPNATCLVQALAGQALLARCGYPSRVCIGVAPGIEGGRTLDAHAWLECGGEVLIGGPAVERYSILLSSGSLPA